MLLHLYWHDLKTRRRKAEEVISFACSSFAKRNSCAV